MEFLALLGWLLLAGTAVVLLPAMITVPGAALVLLAGGGGLLACALFLVLGGPDWAAWVQAGLAVLGIAGATITAGFLCDGDSITGSGVEEAQAAVVGLQLPFLCAVLFASLLLAVHGVDAVV